MSVFSSSTKLQLIGIDTNKDGTIDKYIDVDTNADGKVDARIDTDGNGIAESVALDQNLDRIVDAFLATDLNNDGTDDFTFTDINLDGVFDIYNTKTTTVNNTPQTTLGNTEEAKQILSEIARLTQSTNNIGYKTSLQAAQSAYIESMIEAESTRKTMAMQNQATQQNAILDQQMMALRHNYNVLTKQTEQYVLDAQVREQLTNLFFSLEKTMMDNSFSLAKQVVQSAKY